MNTLLSLVYVSSARLPLGEPALEQLLCKARDRNQQNALTGVLLYNGGNFMQYLEGPAPALQETYRRIARDPLHENVIELLLEPIAERSYSRWDMGFARPTGSEMLALSTARWKQTASGTIPTKDTPVGILLLHSFWQTAQR
ncbi:BLUF domain-containing protein [Rhodoferax sp. WC2427]|uniref:BLUF domain-containing protein n=1 Tax=Rhodoferax sp. WC2427 TaxID=3234144 RepID=UPI0034675FE4